METVNAEIAGTMLGIEDHGIMSCSITLTGDGWGQSFGGWTFDSYDKIKKERVGTAYGCEFIKRVLGTVGVESWEKLKGKHVRIRRTRDKVSAIGHITKEKWFSPEDDMLSFL